MGHIIIGTEAIANGAVTRYELQRFYRPIYTNVHAPRLPAPTLRDRTEAAWLYSKRGGIVSGLAAAAVHGSKWISADIDIELIYHCPRAPKGILARNERIAPDEWQQVGGIPVTTPSRTAFDLGRYRPEYDALARLDALMASRPYSIDDVLLLAKRYKGARGVARLKAVLPFVDGGAESPRESCWRKVILDAGFPTPRTQIPVVDHDGRHVRFLDFGWEKFQVALEYDGDQHQSDRGQYLKDRRVMPELRRLGWHVTAVVKEDDPVAVIQTLSQAMRTRGWHGPIQIPSYAYSARFRAETASRKQKFE
ncbi:hypothetical protein [Mycolicibacterium parafortuitum]|uniref:DUF559 domain-containing protein n=1 Tax=Mycolicibacterium parafortuitum TaxID=39692 RepID=A0A375YHQ9_MYCPF|nr:hypothetical protein [Mycolicibacterium parafortuitum]ORB30672.1 hypothetical protein BST38_10365 [Mycolicibacterium parafortuitum]SRX80579.1 hypothetical protein [Actinoplanes friuliensis DSM 7358] [Mycolicibacterium parafortuitum]